MLQVGVASRDRGVACVCENVACGVCLQRAGHTSSVPMAATFLPTWSRARSVLSPGWAMGGSESAACVLVVKWAGQGEGTHPDWNPLLTLNTAMAVRGRVNQQRWLLVALRAVFCIV